jgi:hypothetical protein
MSFLKAIPSILLKVNWYLLFMHFSLADEIRWAKVRFSGILIVNEVW